MKVKFYKDRLLKSNFILFLSSIFIGLILNFVIWSTINLPFNNPDGVVGKLSIYSFNPSNNIIRFLLFISVPSAIFYIFSSYQKSDIPLVQNEFETNKFSVLLFISLFFFNIFSFLNQDFSTENFDYFHEGLEMLPALNYQVDGGIWSSTLFVRGAFVDLFTAYLGWEIFNTSIGAYRYIVSINNLLVELAFIFLIYSIWVNIRKFQLGNLFPFIAFISYTFSSRIQNLDRRQLVFILGLSLIFLALKFRNKILYFLIGSLSSISIFFSLDTGIFYNLVLILFLILIYKFGYEKNKNLLFGTLGMLFSWAVFISLVGISEFRSFLDNLFFIIKYKDLLDSYIYPNPFLLENFRATLPLIIIMLNLISLVFFYKKIYYDNKSELFILHLILTFSSIIQYRSGLGRSDLLHIEYSSTFIILLFIFNICIFLSFLKNIQKYFVRLNKFFISLFVLFLTFQFLNNIKIDNLVNYQTNLLKFVNLPDKDFTKNEKFNNLTELDEIFKDEKCIFSFGNDSITPYLLRKPSCSKFYLIYFASPNFYQDKVINQLIETSPEFIIYSTNAWYQNIDNIPNKDRINKISNYIQRNYKYNSTVSNNWVIYKKSNLEN